MLMSKAEYARHCGVSRQTVYDWVKKGEVILSGVKIDVTATEQKRAGGNHASDSPWPHRTMEMTFKQAAEWVTSNDGKIPPAATIEEAHQRLAAAADEVGFDTEFMPNADPWIRIYREDEEEHYFMSKSGDSCVRQYLRAEFFHGAMNCPDDLQDWSLEGLTGLCHPAKSE
ncbi:DNA-binding protein [Pectobacterium sp. S5]|uniref:helix-turn-helix transcriptional regulator n=1 Tax=Pectobacterium TaxID=122277 RepID=UPI003D9B0014